MKKYFYILINPLRRLYWFVVRPNTRGAKLIIEHNGHLLMIRNTYGKKHWTFPGGGVNPGESFEAAAIREAWEEVGINVRKAHIIGQYTNNHEYKHDTVECYYSTVESDNFKVDPSEILEAKWVKLNQIPTPATPRLSTILGFRENYIKAHH